MPNTTHLNVTVNKITKALYDEYVADEIISQQEIDEQVWIFTDDQFVSAADMLKLAGIEAGADVNIVEGIKVNGTAQSPTNKIINIVVPTKVSELTNDSGFITADNLPTCSSLGAIPTSAKGATGGVAELDDSGKVPSAQLPSYVDDVLEYNTQSAFPATGEDGKIYVDKATNKTYRWGGTAYVEISASLALGETSGTAYRGDRGKTAYEHSQAAHAPSGAQANVIETVKVNGSALTVTGKAVDITIPTCESGAEVNAIETVKVNGAALTPDASRAVDIAVPTCVTRIWS